MRQNLRQNWKMSEGTRARILAFFLAALSSGGLGFLAVVHLDQRALFEEMTRYQMWIVLASAIGGVAALFLAGDRVGLGGQYSMIRAIAGSIWVTFVGALIGGTLALPLYGTMFGPFIVTVTLLGAPVIAVIWAFNLVAIHYLLGVYQRERDTIFAEECPTVEAHPNTLSVRMAGKVIKP